MADIYAPLEQEAAGGGFMFGVALADSVDGKVLVRLDDDITAPFDEEPAGASVVDFGDDAEGSVGDIDEDSAALELGDDDVEGAVAADETSEIDSEGGVVDEVTEPDALEDDGFDELTANGGE